MGVAWVRAWLGPGHDLAWAWLGPGPTLGPAPVWEARRSLEGARWGLQGGLERICEAPGRLGMGWGGGLGRGPPCMCMDVSLGLVVRCWVFCAFLRTENLKDSS